jgi:DNA-directed RNA polymerase specialized sigma24 family protein
MPKLNYLRPKHKRAIEMKWHGSQYKEITGEVGVSIDTVKFWFRANGFLREAYGTYRGEQILNMDIQEKQERIKALTSNDSQQSTVDIINSLSLPIRKMFQKLPVKEKDAVMERFFKLNRESEERMNNYTKRHQLTLNDTKNGKEINTLRPDKTQNKPVNQQKSCE